MSATANNLDGPRREVLYVRVAAEERRVVKQAAATAGKGIAEWCRDVMLEEANRVMCLEADRIREQQPAGAG